MKIKAKKIRIEFNNSSEDFWEATCGSGIEFDEAMRMIPRAWEEHDASAEPLIKDEKIRKAVRAWAEANRDVSQVMFSKDVTGKSYSYLTDTDSDAQIKFNFVIDGELDIYEVYTIAELCGTPPEPLEPTFVDLDERIKEKEEE